MVNKTDGKGLVPADEKQNALATIEDSMFDDEGSTREGASQDTMSIPFLGILQSTSPQVVEGGTEYIEGARPGMLFNSVTKECINTKTEKVRLVNIAFKESYVEWVPRQNGGGFVGEYAVDVGVQGKTQRNDTNQDIIQAGSLVGTPGNQLTYTHTHFCFLVREDGSFSPVVMAMAITQVKPSKDWNFLINNFTVQGRSVKRFATIWDAATLLREKDGNRWYVWQFTKSGDGLLNAEVEGGGEIFKKAAEFRTGVISGEHKADLAKMDESSGAAAGGGQSEYVGGDENLDSEIPF